MTKKDSDIGCCGIDCGLCPRYYTDGPSRCPGCGGEDFAVKHPACSIHACCHLRHGLAICSLCEEYPCGKYKDRERIDTDSFVTHQRIFANHEAVLRRGYEAFHKERVSRQMILQAMLRECDDGRSKSFYCIAAALLPLPDLRDAYEAANRSPFDPKQRAKQLRASLAAIAGREHLSLVLQPNNCSQ